MVGANKERDLFCPLSPPRLVPDQRKPTRRAHPVALACACQPRRAGRCGRVVLLLGAALCAARNCSAIFFVEPLLLTGISAPFLGEPIGWRRVSAVEIGFIGALIVIRPSFEAVGLAPLLPLLSALCFALYLAIVRHRAPAPASVLAPFRYLEIFGSILLGALIFDHLPDVLTCVGTAIIIGSAFTCFAASRSWHDAIPRKLPAWRRELKPLNRADDVLPEIASTPRSGAADSPR